ncbi:conserved hypothetical protein [Methylorubrum populi BJ001]|jgi:hypothetical protein|uniref:Uncharacterized protein n=1 Tax=Methylorubrum populi (strain ATCC BAA-705 / NCIMB 13946 / BJ001) TaxID=441620 RepID=B1ZF22_METPB|nr:hypothetical protein [Methylorubrum populi]ACB78269.1 conserved hypothetical protein [Methylorubrum populi BJ001]PZP66397.1 MAG: hypothetical protein DI590_24015 [Methylorubrum populi]
MPFDRHALIEFGEGLYGTEWRRALARALGPLHPKGARPTIDPRLPARWATGERDIPPWVGPAVLRLARERLQRIEDYAREAGIDLTKPAEGGE